MKPSFSYGSFGYRGQRVIEQKEHLVGELKIQILVGGGSPPTETVSSSDPNRWVGGKVANAASSSRSFPRGCAEIQDTGEIYGR